ncbi:G-type lectin S-receptor-like serine/threonine-protein kinase At2g19130 [Rosa rugosa]|uniref:G-type lectin S-receptor-like serine/threonine-protein kinase At2g19130 n=1 Tax=Rosa rugosa TaxID=74645 RepID=UPI002B40BF15|nr:G-type lectin S-receptor-like serine/threonine-protein kinase At2g19130 [Rosa rugosa]
MIRLGSECVLVVLCCFIIISFGAHLSTASDKLIPGQSLSGNQTLTSPAGKFELGFFTRGNSNNHYIGIWYANLPNHTVVWVANRNHPVPDPVSSEFRFLENGNVTLLDQSKSSIWSTQNSMSSVSKSATYTARLLDNGNFVIQDASGVIWQSFDHPTDTWLPGGARLGYNKLTNQKLALTPWKNPQDPAPGIFSLEIEPNGTSFWLLYNGSQQYWNSGPWNGKSFAQVPEIERNDHIANVTFVSDDKGSYVSYDSADPDTYIRYMVDTTGQFKVYMWGKDFTQWLSFWLRPTEFCEVYGFCGASSICQQNASLCVCMEGYEPKVPKEWELGDHTDGCVRKAPLQCITGVDDTFVVSDVRLPVNPETLAVDDSDECRLACLRNCSCTAFAYDSGCLVWGGDLFNVKQFTPDEKEGKDLHLQIPASERIEGKKENRTLWIIIGVLGGLFIVITIVVVLFVKHRCFGEKLDTLDGSLVMFRYRALRKATNNFSEKLGEGGFGSVFKGTLQGSIAIAVKRLNCPKQEDNQFLTEVRTIGKVQHINLIRLCGFCAEASKRFLVYEYMPNGSLESVLFKNSSIVLDWKARYQIAIGTARGLAYLHEECRECIIHCDIKPENILLDAEYVPKVSDFGLAKLIDRDISRIITTMKGTRGYIAPEWISGEAITSKADTFSYGMLLFELISGRRNRDLLDNALENYFPTRVANVLNKEEDVDALLDYRLEGNADKEQLSRACKVACWCIQDDEKGRPTMGQVVQLLEGVIDAGIPPMPKFLDRFSKSLVESINYRYITSSSSGSCHHEYSDSIYQA